MHTKVIAFRYAKGGVVLKTSKMGRPTDNPKLVQLAIRFDNDTLKILDEYCQEMQITRTEGIRQAVKKLK